MKKTLVNVWKYGCVPIVLLGGEAVFALAIRIGYLSTAVRFILAQLLLLTGMFLLRKVPRRALVVSSGLACAVSLANQLLMVYRILFGNMGPYENRGFIIAQKLLGVLSAVPNNITLPLAKPFGYDIPLAAAIVLTAVEVLIPMVFVFSGVFNRTAARRKEGAEDCSR